MPSAFVLSSVGTKYLLKNETAQGKETPATSPAKEPAPSAKKSLPGFEAALAVIGLFVAAEISLRKMF
jgi:hypothetical protein